MASNYTNRTTVDGFTYHRSELIELSHTVNVHRPCGVRHDIGAIDCDDSDLAEAVRRQAEACSRLNIDPARVLGPRWHRHLDDNYYWNANGEVTCTDHAPYKGGSLWTLEGWEAIPAPVLDELRETAGDADPCAACSR